MKVDLTGGWVIRKANRFRIFAVSEELANSTWGLSSGGIF